MTQADIDRAVRRATGETRQRIGQTGFSLLVLRPPRPRKWIKRWAKSLRGTRSTAPQLAVTS